MTRWAIGLAAACGFMTYVGGAGNRDLQRRGYHGSKRQPSVFYRMDSALGIDMSTHYRRIRTIEAECEARVAEKAAAARYDELERKHPEV